MRLLIALGGNALLPRGAVADASLQVHQVETVAPVLAALATEHEVIITHGNGPQVGLVALESAADESLSRPYPFDALVAETQGLLGYWLQRAIGSAGLRRPIVSLVTQTLVDATDPAFDRPTKFVGPVYSADEARHLASERGWCVALDGDRWRRVVASPAPIDVVERPVITQLVGHGTTVICAGGGGVPVARTGPDGSGGLVGVEAVVDKDHVAALLALQLHAELLLLVTDVPNVFVGYGTADARPLGDVTPDDLGDLDLPSGSMGPKVAAACRFARLGRGPAVIGALADLPALVAGTAGTRVRRAASIA